MYERHGYSGKDRIYRIWFAMRQRCSKTYSNSFPAYGARGVKVCEAWDTSFIAFRDWALAHGYDESLSIDRIDGTKGYEPSNCRWATHETQQENRAPAKSLKLAEYQGETMHLRDWSRRTNIGYTTLMRRYNSGKRGDQLFAPV